MAGVEGGESIWSRQHLPRNHVLPLGSVLFGTFQVIDANTENNAFEDDANIKDEFAESYVDFGFGSDRSSFSGFHRLSVTRLQPTDEMIGDIEKPISNAESHSTLVKLTFSCFTCSPNQDKPMASGFLRTFHLTYAMLLFREGVASVLRA